MAGTRKKPLKGIITLLVIFAALVLIVTLSESIKDEKRAERNNETIIEQRKEIKGLKNELEEKQATISQLEAKIQQLEYQQSTPQAINEFVDGAFHPNGTHYQAIGDNVAFYTNIELDERVKESEIYFLSEESIEVNPLGGVKSFAYWSNLGVVYCTSRLTLEPIQ